MGRRHSAGGGGGAENANSPTPLRPAALTVGDVAAELQISLRKVEELVASGELPSFKVGAFRRVSRAALDDFMANGGAPTRRGQTRRDSA
jgi:excisionase family DNA binding protein